MRHVFYLLLSATALCFAVPIDGLAQTEQERIDQLERDVLILQRQLARKAPDTASSTDDVTGVSTGASDVRITALEEDIRSLRGKLEEKEFDIRSLSETLDRFKRDAEFRLNALEQTPAADNNTAPKAVEPKTPATDKPKPESASTEKATTPDAPAAAKGKMELSVKEAGSTSTEEDSSAPAFESARDHYNYAFRLLNQNQYDDAAKSFSSFIKKNPSDALVGNAYYWLGETHYIRSDFAKAADQFRQGYEAMPKGPKSADNLLKLGMSLAKQDKTKEACVILSQVMSNYATSAASTATKATGEHKRIGCQ
mgnify:CR=1 FL=1